jgi:hypothetical protein
LFGVFLEHGERRGFIGFEPMDAFDVGFHESSDQFRLALEKRLTRGKRAEWLD